MKYITAKLMLVALLAAVAVGAATLGALADAHFRIAGGVYGVEPGYGRATLICVDKDKDIANGVTIKTHPMPLSYGGRSGTGVAVSCP
jgi:hypothetical protein